MNGQETVNQYESYGIELRRQIHRHPELSNKEHNTTAFIRAELAKSGIEPVDLGLETGLVADIHGKKPGAGRMVAQSALDGMEGALCVGLINYEVNGANGRDREQGARDAFAESGRARITAAVSTHPNATSARADTLAMLRTHPEINVLIALSETTAVGAAQAVQQMQRADDLWLAAFDSNIETIDALQTGTVDALIVQNTYGMGYFGVESAYKLLAGQGSSVEKSNITATRTITRENMFAMDKQKALFPFG